MINKQFIVFCLVVLPSCSSVVERQTPSTEIAKTIIKESVDGNLTKSHRKILLASLEDLDRQILAQSKGYDELTKKYETLEKDYDILQKKYAESQKDAGWKELLLWAFWGFIGIFILWNGAKFVGKFSGLIA